MDQQKLDNYVVNLALGNLYWDDVHPDVGMGMWPSTAIEYAIEAAVNTARVFDVELDPKCFDRAVLLARVREERR